MLGCVRKLKHWQESSFYSNLFCPKLSFIGFRALSLVWDVEEVHSSKWQKIKEIHQNGRIEGNALIKSLSFNFIKKRKHVQKRLLFVEKDIFRFFASFLRKTKERMFLESRKFELRHQRPKDYTVKSLNEKCVDYARIFPLTNRGLWIFLG